MGRRFIRGGTITVKLSHHEAEVLNSILFDRKVASKQMLDNYPGYHKGKDGKKHRTRVRLYKKFQAVLVERREDES